MSSIPSVRVKIVYAIKNVGRLLLPFYAGSRSDRTSVVSRRVLQIRPMAFLP
jgi:hypothetical protein